MTLARNWLITHGDDSLESIFQLRTVQDSPVTFNFVEKVFKSMTLVPTGGAEIKAHKRAGREPRLEFTGSKPRTAVLTGMYIVEEHAQFRTVSGTGFDFGDETVESGPTLSRISAARQDLLIPLFIWMESGLPVRIIRFGMLDIRFIGSWLISDIRSTVIQFERQADTAVRFNINLMRASLI